MYKEEGNAILFVTKNYLVSRKQTCSNHSSSQKDHDQHSIFPEPNLFHKNRSSDTLPNIL